MDKGIHIIQTGHYVPEHIVTNEEMSHRVETSDEWIKSRTGIEQRHFVTNQDCVDLAYEASKKALDNIDLSQVGIVIVASISSPYKMPSIACLLQERLGLEKEVLAFDVNAACSGFVYGLSIARALLLTSQKKYALVVGSETLSKMIGFNDRTTCVLFGDGAGAMVIELNDSLYLDYQGAQGNKEPLYASQDGYIQMQGREVFRFATSSLVHCIETLLNQAHLNKEEIDYYVVHQANLRIIAHVYKKLALSSDKFYVNVNQYGNTSGASIPIALSEMNEKGLLKKGMKIMMIGFGGGLTYGANLIEW